jgi:hypothetical protein
MNYRKSQSRVVVWSVLVIISIASCGRDRTEVYDTKNNPDNYPDMAVDLIAKIESGDLTGAENITGAFGDLYTEHPELLDHSKWTRVIERLGMRFNEIADSLVEQGLAHYGDAAEYYQLSTFARPGDSTVRFRAALFDCWYRAEHASQLNLTPLVVNPTIEWPKAVEITRYFALSDTLSLEFFRTLLAQPVRERLEAAGQLDMEVVGALSPADRALVSFAGIVKELPSDVEATFARSATETQVDLIAQRVYQLGTDSYAAEAYFVARTEAPTWLTGLLVMTGADSGKTVFAIPPVEPTACWKKDKITACRQEFKFEAVAAGASIGLVDASHDPPLPYPINETQDTLYPVAAESIIP